MIKSSYFRKLLTSPHRKKQISIDTIMSLSNLKKFCCYAYASSCRWLKCSTCNWALWTDSGMAFLLPGHWPKDLGFEPYMLMGLHLMLRLSVSHAAYFLLLYVKAILLVPRSVTSGILVSWFLFSCICHTNLLCLAVIYALGLLLVYPFLWAHCFRRNSMWALNRKRKY